VVVQSHMIHDQQTFKKLNKSYIYKVKIENGK